MFQHLASSDPCLFLSCVHYLSAALLFYVLICHIHFQLKDSVVAALVPEMPSSQISKWLVLLECQGSSHWGPPHRGFPFFKKIIYLRGWGGQRGVGGEVERISSRLQAWNRAWSHDLSQNQQSDTRPTAQRPSWAPQTKIHSSPCHLLLLLCFF